MGIRDNGRRRMRNMESQAVGNLKKSWSQKAEKPKGEKSQTVKMRARSREGVKPTEIVLKY